MWPGVAVEENNLNQAVSALRKALGRVNSSLPIVVERAQYWPDPVPSWYEAHNSFGLTSLGTRWGP